MIKNIFSAVLAVFLLASCASVPQRENFRIDQTIFKSKPKIVIVTMNECLKPIYRQEGQQGLLDALINQAFANDVNEGLDKIDAQPIVDKAYFDNFKQTFTNMGAKTTVEKLPLSEKDFVKVDPNMINLSPYDFSALSKKYNADYALVMTVESFGLVRSYYGFIPTSAPHAYANVHIYLVNLKDNSLVGYYRVAEQNQRSAGGWCGHNQDELVQLVEQHLEFELIDGHRFLLS
ncbi:MAG: hypothetical protein CNLJKLNK_00372 [Holosporales bacterium]